MFGRASRGDAAAEAKARSDSLSFIATEIGAAVDSQLATADALDVKIAGLFALSVASVLAYLATAEPIARLDLFAATGSGLAIGYGFGCASEAAMGLRATVYYRWPDPAAYVKLALGPDVYDKGDLAEQAAIGKAAAHKSNQRELKWKSTRLGWTAAFLFAQIAVTLIAALHAVTL